MDALKGAANLFRTGKIDVVMTEAVFVAKYSGQPLLNELWEYLLDYDFSLYSLEDVKIGLYDSEDQSLRQNQWNQCDAIFISEEVRAHLDG